MYLQSAGQSGRVRSLKALFPDFVPGKNDPRALRGGLGNQFHHLDVIQIVGDRPPGLRQIAKGRVIEILVKSRVQPETFPR